MIIKYLLLLICTVALVACNNQPQENSQDNEQAFKEFSEFVTKAEDKANTEYNETVLRAMRKADRDSSAWQTETAELMQEYESKKKKVEDNLSSYDAKQQEEFRDLDNRYNLALEKQKSKDQEISHRYKLRNELLGLPVTADDMSNITADELAGTYQRFIQKLTDRSIEIKDTDWNLIKGWWNALNNRKNELESKLPADAKNKINQATKEYQAIIESRSTTP